MFVLAICVPWRALSYRQSPVPFSGGVSSGKVTEMSLLPTFSKALN